VHPYFKWMRERLGKAPHPAWNFHKLLTDKTVAPFAAFKSKVEPGSG
jgi:glutathione peroxidase-family protein